MNSPTGVPTAPNLENKPMPPEERSGELAMPPDAQPEASAGPEPQPEKTQDNFWQNSEPNSLTVEIPASGIQTSSETISEDKIIEQDKERVRQARQLVEMEPASAQDVINLAKNVDSIINADEIIGS